MDKGREWRRRRGARLLTPDNLTLFRLPKDFGERNRASGINRLPQVC